MLEIRDRNNKETIMSKSNLDQSLRRLFRAAWKILVSLVKDAFEVSGRIQL